ncbi:MAG: GPW/gp25 family protein [Bacteroidota bacterium]
MDYYSMPLRVDKIMQGVRKEGEVEIRESIHQNIRLILKTFSLSYRYDPTFGCVLNKYQGSTPPQKKSERLWREAMRESIQKHLKDMLQRYETRIKVKEVIVDLLYPKKKGMNALVNVSVQITGQLALGRREIFHYPDSEVADEAQEVLPLMIPVK